MRRGKKPTKKQKDRLWRAGLSPDNWLVVKEKPAGELVLLNRHTDKIKVAPASVGQLRQKEKPMDYIYIGNVSGYSQTPSEPDTLTVHLYDPSDKKKSPAMLAAHGTLARYIHELSCTDYEEKYMRKRFHYNGLCVLQKVEVLDYNSAKHVVKTIVEGSNFSQFID